MSRLRTAIVVLLLTLGGVVATGCSGNPNAAPSPRPTHRELGRAQIELAAGDQLVYLAESAEGALVASQRTAWTISSETSAPERSTCCGAKSRIVTGSVDLSGKPWLVLSDGTPVDLDGVTHPAAAATKDLVGPATSVPKLPEVDAHRVVQPRSVAVVNATTIILATRSLTRVKGEPQHAEDVRIWKLTAGRPPVRLAGTPSVAAARVFWAPASTYDRSGADPLLTQLDSVQSMVALSPTEFMVAMWSPVGPISVGLLSPRNFRELSTGLHPPKVVHSMARRHDRAVDLSGRGFPGSGSVFVEIQISQAGDTLGFGSPGRVYREENSGNLVRATPSRAGVAVVWTGR